MDGEPWGQRRAGKGGKERTKAYEESEAKNCEANKHVGITSGTEGTMNRQDLS